LRGLLQVAARGRIGQREHPEREAYDDRINTRFEERNSRRELHGAAATRS
jgi:hypothetical protein